MVRIERIIAPSDARRREATQEVIDLAASCARLGRRPIHPLACVKTRQGWEIKSGRNRYCAALRADLDWLPVLPILDANDYELMLLELHENLHRRHDDKAALLATLDKAEAAITGRASEKADDEPAKRGRPETTRGEARRLVAAATGRSVDAIRKAEARALEDTGRASGNASNEEPKQEAPLVEMHGRTMDIADVKRTRQVVHGLDAVLRATADAYDALNDLQGSRGPTETWKPAKWREMLAAITKLKTLASSLRPAHACPCNDDHEGECSYCGGEKTLTAEEWKLVPPDVRDPSEHAAGLDAAVAR
jgi:hypothetical protein